MTTTVYLMRHGATSWGEDGNRYTGRTDIPLSAAGRHQAAAAAGTMLGIHFAAAYSSSLLRAQETAAAIAGPHGLVPILEESLVEIDFGEWEGKRRDEIMRDDPEHWSRWVSDPASIRAGHTGETGSDVFTRASETVNRLASAHEGASILLVTHNTLSRLLIAGSLAMPMQSYRQLEQATCCVNIVRIAPMSPWHWVAINRHVAL